MTETLQRSFLKANRAKCQVDIDLVEQLIVKAKEISVKHGVSISDILDAKRVLEIERANDLKTQDGDYIDCHVETLYLCMNAVYERLFNDNPNMINFADIRKSLKLLSEVLYKNGKKKEEWITSEGQI